MIDNPYQLQIDQWMCLRLSPLNLDLREENIGSVSYAIEGLLEFVSRGLPSTGIDDNTKEDYVKRDPGNCILIMKRVPKQVDRERP